MQITLQIDQALTRRVSDRERAEVSVIDDTELGRLMASRAIEVKPQHSGKLDPALACFFSSMCRTAARQSSSSRSFSRHPALRQLTSSRSTKRLRTSVRSDPRKEALA